MLRHLLPLLVLTAAAAWAQKYDGPRPAKPDLPYLRHGQNLIPLDAAEAKEEHKKDDVLYTVEGEAATARTPMVSPIFLIRAEKITPDRLQLFRLTVHNGRREILFQAKRPPKPILMEVTRLSSDGIFRLEVEGDLEPGEYSLSPQGTDQVFCFQVF
jgi:hypothetical protein